ncbi:hypothetical protein M9H77_19349 [Catharanthus roseus]|uniref:Uncharacterized protein n=1 Tax=Catharanthus roseus TaxID=4058 RepID=A0ACC0BA21_CATRO|nr:hypothetical protein M9H77_19349 [Catharanthus roseus]
MDIPTNCVARRTRNQLQKAEKELLEKAKILKEERDRRKRCSRRSSKDVRGEACIINLEILEDVPHNQGGEMPQSSIARLHQEQTLVSEAGHEEQLLENAKTLNDNKVRRKTSVGKSSKCRSSDSSSSDVEFLGAEYVPLDQRMVLPKSRVAKRDIVIKQTPVSSAGHDHSRDANQNQGTDKDIGAPSRSSSASSSEEEVTNYKGDDLLLSRQLEIVNSSAFDLESSSSEEVGGEPDNCELLEDGNQSEEHNVEIDGTSLSPSESSSEENISESDDSDYMGNDLVQSDSDSDDSSEEKHAGSSCSRQVIADENRLEYKETDAVDKKRKAVNVHEVSGKKKKVLGLDIWIDDDTKRDDEVNKSLLERLRPRQVSKSTKEKLKSGKLSCPIKVFESEASDELDDAKVTDHIVQERNGKASKNIGKKSERKNFISKNIDFMNILSDSIWEKSDALKEKLTPLVEKSPDKYALPLKFRFEDEEPAPPEKDEAQKEVDNLFADLEMGWTEDDIGCTKLPEEDRNEDAAKVTDPVDSCTLGNHSLILDEEIGFICKYCGIVQQEIKHVLPDLKTPNRRRHEQFDSHYDDFSISYGFQFGDFPSGDHHTFIDTEGPVFDLIPAVFRRQMYLHQLNGFQFLWKNIGGATLIEDIKTPLSEGGDGCIISHAPGTGKTYLTIVFLLTFMKVYPTCHPMIIAPLTMLRSWADEIKRWKIDIPFHNLNDPELSGEENTIASSIAQRVRNSKKDKKQDRDYKRMVKLYSWTKNRSILGIGYNLFEKLAGDHRKGDHAEKFRKILLEMPSILILDEGHTPRNQNSLLWKALTKVKTGRRIILSGTPFQNNFDELYNTFCLVNPKFAEHGAKRKKNPAKGRWASLTNLIDKNADDALDELRAMMDPFVHVHKGTILQESLLGLRDTLVVLNPTDLQKKLLQRIPNNVFEKVHLVSLISAHPSLVAEREEFSDHRSILEQVKMSPEAGVKTQFVIEIVRLSNARGEKVLIFSEYIDPLNFLMKQLTSHFSWEEGEQVLYMDGQLDEKQRQVVIHSLNTPNSEAKVLLASTKACCEGINLVGASRVVLLDVVWNPSVERQAISRAYRLGQKKFVYVYHLIMSGTMEIEKYQMQTKKDRLSELVFSSPAGHNYCKSEISDDKILEAMVNHKKLHHIFEKVLHQPKESNVFENFSFVSFGNCLVDPKKAYAKTEFRTTAVYNRAVNYERTNSKEELLMKSSCNFDRDLEALHGRMGGVRMKMTLFQMDIK